MALSAIELQLGVFQFLLTTHMETNANKMHPRSLCSVRHLTRIYLHVQTTADAGDMHLTNDFDYGKTLNTINWRPMPEKMAQIL